MEANGGPPKIEGYHLYNDKTSFNAFLIKMGDDIEQDSIQMQVKEMI